MNHNSKIVKLKEDITDFKEFMDNNDPHSMTPERFSGINTMLTTVEEEIMEMESEYSELILHLKDFKECIQSFRKKYFEALDKDKDKGN